jgi:hypothetical protein
VEYDVSKVNGTLSEDILSNTNIYDLTEPDSVYGLVRESGVYDRVALPPYSGLDFLYWSANMSQESVNISSLKVFLSRQELYMGDLNQVMYIEGGYENFLVRFRSNDLLRSGITKTYPGFGTVASGSGYIDGMVLDRAYIKPALEFVKWEAQVKDGVALIRVLVANVSNQLLNNVLFKHGEYSRVRDFNGYEEYIYEYILEIDETSSLGYASLYDPNIMEECIVVGQDTGSNGIGESAILGGVMESNGNYFQYISSRVKPWGESFCVTRIPYTFYSGEMKLTVEDEEIPSENIPEEVEKEVVYEEGSESVLGIEKLPQTGSNIFSFLVVFPILWYYLLRRLRI